MSPEIMSSMSSSTTHMQMTFFTSSVTPLFTNTWTPSTGSQYGGTCFFLIILSLIFRLLIFGKVKLESRWESVEARRRTIVVKGQQPYEDDGGKEGSGQDDVVKRREGRKVPPWRMSTDLPRAVYVTLLAGVGYLLMLAVMTMNVGYFLSVLGGIFAGELFVGRYIEGLAHDHH